MKFSFRSPRITCFILALFLSCLALASTVVAEQTPNYTDPVTGMQFVYLPGGTFVMGDVNDRFAHPAHEVTVPPFYMGKYEVTFAQYDRFCFETGRQKPDDEGWGRGIRPVINVTWHDAVAFTQWLSEKTGRIFRLPSEAEWEYAARGGLNTDYPWGNGLGRSNANCRGCGSPWDRKSTSPIGSFSPNQFGLFDMSGNVYEWCLDNRHNDFRNAPTDGSAWTGGPHKEWRVNRGGSWRRNPVEVSVFARCWDPESKATDELGFRLVMEN